MLDIIRLILADSGIVILTVIIIDYLIPCHDNPNVILIDLKSFIIDIRFPEMGPIDIKLLDIPFSGINDAKRLEIVAMFQGIDTVTVRRHRRIGLIFLRRTHREQASGIRHVLLAPGLCFHHDLEGEWLLVIFRGVPAFDLFGNTYRPFDRHVELDTAVGVTAAAFHIEDLHGVVLFIIFDESSWQAAVIPVLHLNIAGPEIDRAADRLMNAADIQNQLVIDKDPHIIIAGKLKDNVISIRVLAGRRNQEVGFHMHGKMVFQGLVHIDGTFCLVFIIGHKREKSDGHALVFILVKGRTIDRKLVLYGIAGRIQRSKIPITVKCKISVGGFLKQFVDTIQLCIGSGTVEQITQGFRGDTIAGPQGRISVDQLILYNPLLGNPGSIASARIVIDSV